MVTKVYREIAAKALAIQNCEKSGNTEWHCKHSDKLARLIDNTAPSGSGIDNGVHFLGYEKGKLKFSADFHHMDENGYYDGWTEHVVTVEPCLFNEISITVSGRNRNEIKEYLGELFHNWLTEEIDTDAI